MIGLGLFLAGGMFAFGFSYRPLHGAISWQVDELESRVDERNLENQRLGDELARLRSQDEARIEPETFVQVERDLDKTRKAPRSGGKGSRAVRAQTTGRERQRQSMEEALRDASRPAGSDSGSGARRARQPLFGSHPDAPLQLESRVDAQADPLERTPRLRHSRGGPRPDPRHRSDVVPNGGGKRHAPGHDPAHASVAPRDSLVSSTEALPWPGVAGLTPRG